MANPLPPMPRDPIGENHKWRDWLNTVRNSIVGVAGSVPITHDSLSSISGGTSTERYHTTLAQYTGLVGGGETALHVHDHAAQNNLNSTDYTHLTAANHTDLTDGGDSALHYHATDRLLSNITGFGANVATALATPTTANFNAMLSDNDFATLAGTETLTNKTLTSPDINGGTVDSAAIGATTPSTGVFTTLSSTENATLGDSIIFDEHTINGAATLNSAEFAAISASLPALSYVASCFHLEANDTVKWRKRKGQSWRSEDRSPGKYLGVYANATAAVAAGGATGDVFYNTTAAAFHEITAPTTSSVTYRAGREDYPTNALITAEAQRVIIWDLDGAVPSMWMVIIGVYQYMLFATVAGGNYPISCVGCQDGSIFVGNNGITGLGVQRIDFNGDTSYLWRTTATINGGRWPLNIASRHSAQTRIPDGSALLVNGMVNSVAITVLPDAPVDEYGMPVPTIFAATDAGVSVINNNGTVADLVDVAGDDTNEVVFDRNNNCYFTNETQGDLDMFLASNYDADDTTPDALYNEASVPALLAAITATKQGLVATKDAIVAGHSTGMSILVPSTAAQANGMVAYATSAFNSGYMVGDIRRCFLANSKTADRSVKAATLTEVGTVTETTYTGGRSVYSGFSASNYFQEASHADWNALGTGDFSIIMSGVKWGTTLSNRPVLSMGAAGAGALTIYIGTTGTIALWIHNGTSWGSVCATTSTFTDTAEHVLEVKRSGTTISIVVDGVVVATATSALTISNATGVLTVGSANDTGVFGTAWTGGRVSCVRISATAPTAEQSKYIAAYENALNGGNTCLLSNSNTVSTLTYNEVTGCYEVGNGTNVDTFSGLQRIASQAHGVTTLKSISSSGPYKLIAGTGATFTADERNVKSELSEQSKRSPRRVTKSITTDASGNYALNTANNLRGWKAVGMAQTASANAAITQTFDGFCWTITGLTAATAYTITVEEV